MFNASRVQRVFLFNLATFFWARLIYTPLYYFEVPVLKTTVWFISLGATLVLAYELLK